MFVRAVKIVNKCQIYGEEKAGKQKKNATHAENKIKIEEKDAH